MFSENPLEKRPEIVDYYPRHVETYKLMMRLRYYGLYRDEHEDFKDEMKRVRALRGKEWKGPKFAKKKEEKSS